MIPLRPASLFRSRWAALVYAAGVLWFAADMAGSPPDPPAANDAATSEASNASLDALEARVHALEGMK